MEKILGNEIKINKQLYDFEILNKKSINYNIGSKRENTLQNDEKKLIDDIVDISVKHSNPEIKSLIYFEILSNSKVSLSSKLPSKSVNIKTLWLAFIKYQQRAYL